MSKYSDELFINAISNSVTLSATNASLSAYCRFTYDRNFFTRFNVGNRDVRDALPDMDDAEQTETAAGQLCVQVHFLAGETPASHSKALIVALANHSQTQNA